MCKSCVENKPYNQTIWDKKVFCLNAVQVRLESCCDNSTNSIGQFAQINVSRNVGLNRRHADATSRSVVPASFVLRRRRADELGDDADSNRRNDRSRKAEIGRVRFGLGAPPKSDEIGPQDELGQRERRPGPKTIPDKIFAQGYFR